MKNIPFYFHKTRMIIRLTTDETNGAYSVIEMEHLPSVGPARHIHPRGVESFVVLAGDYVFSRNNQETRLGVGESISIPANTPHRYLVGSEGGRLLVICPPGLENYFWESAQLLVREKLSLAEEFALAAKHGQDFLDTTSHWGHK